VVTAMGTCILTIMGIFAQREGIPLEGARVRATKIMAAAPPRRIARCELHFDMPAGIQAQKRPALERIVDSCPVRRSLRPETEIEVTFHYPD